MLIQIYDIDYYVSCQALFVFFEVHGNYEYIVFLFICKIYTLFSIVNIVFDNGI